MLNFQRLVCYSSFFLFFASCSIEKQISKSAKADVLDTKALQTAHVGISIFEPATNNYLYNYQGDKYFIPASNTKLPTCYAAMKYLGDSLVGLRYIISQIQVDTGIISGMLIEPTGDPTFLHPDFKQQKVYNFLKNTDMKIGLSMPIFTHLAYGRGWSISDLNESYMPPRTNWPVYGNVAQVTITKDTLTVTPKYMADSNLFYHALSFEKVPVTITKSFHETQWIIKTDTSFNRFTKQVPFTLENDFLGRLIKDTLKKSIYRYLSRKHSGFGRVWQYYLSPFNFDDSDFYYMKLSNPSIIHSQPTDSLLKPMMHNSDNFFAEQSLLMVSNEMLGVMNDEKIIDTLLKTDFKDLPQKPRWADGSGLSRYNLFTPQDFVAILNKMKNEFGMERIKVILPTGGEGTISNYYKADSGYIYGKTGTLSGVVAFSGFLYTKKGKLLIFSTLVNNHQSSATEVRRAVEKFLEGVRNKY
jgi:D-alanyl-D-alanine carboxypeptidase/D-alanyl-D-alanine-endopeptidase (penicillin-binding protein 4)